jgi:hypothetical protein
MHEYLEALTNTCRRIIGPDLTGVYLYGSTVVDETARLSDIDILLLVARPLSGAQKHELAAQLDHARLPVPASGLELMAILAETAKAPPPNPMVEFALTTGEAWPAEVQSDVEYEEVLLDTAMARESARALYGPPAQAAFGMVERARLLRLIVQALEWHLTRLLDPHHDPLGQNSILNAARAWTYASTERLVSKAQGGRWVLSQKFEHPLVEAALAIREGGRFVPPGPNDISQFLRDVIAICRAAQA